MQNIIDNPQALLKLNSSELDELLIDKYKNSALLRELIRRCLHEIKSQNDLIKLYKNNYEKSKEDLAKIENLVNKLQKNELTDLYNIIRKD